MACPNCGNHFVLLSDHRVLHYIRIFSFSHKRYCPSCHAKWRMRTYGKARILRDLFSVLVFAFIGFLILYILNAMGIYPPAEKLGSKQVSGQEAMLREMKRRMQQNPGSVAPGGASAAQLEAMKKYMKR